MPHDSQVFLASQAGCDIRRLRLRLDSRSIESPAFSIEPARSRRILAMPSLHLYGYRGPVILDSGISSSSIECHCLWLSGSLYRGIFSPVATVASDTSRRNFIFP